MVMYWALLLAPSALSAMQLRRRVIQIFFGLLFVLFLIAVGLRDRVGMDWSNYEAIYYSLAATAPTAEDFTREPAFYLVNFVASEFGLGITFVNLAHAFVFLGGLFYFAYKRCPNRFLALAVATPYLVIVVGMSGIRQAAAIGVFMYLLAVWDRLGTTGKIALLVLASAFHTSAILLSSVVVVDSKRNPVKMFFASLIAIGVGLYVLAGSHDYYITSYVEENLESPGAIFHALLIIIPAAIFVGLRKRFEEGGLYDRVLFRMSVLALCICPLLMISSTGVDRFLLYFTPVQMYVFSALPRVLKTSPLVLALAIVNAAILYTWLYYANNSEAWRDYSSCLVIAAGCF